MVVNEAGSVTEVDAATGALVQVLSDSSYNFSGPSGIAFDGTNLWVINTDNSTVTEISSADGSLQGVTEINASDGSLVRVLADLGYQFDGPDDLAFDGSRIWATNENGNSVTEIPAVRRAAGSA